MNDDFFIHPVANELHGCSHGHWWDHFDGAEPPDRPQIQYFLNEEVRGLEAVPPEHHPDVPERVDWSQYVHYICRWESCQDNCINRADSPYAQTKSCRACYAERDSDELTVVKHHLPDRAKGLGVDHTARRSDPDSPVSASSSEARQLVEDGGQR